MLMTDVPDLDPDAALARFRARLAREGGARPSEGGARPSTGSRALGALASARWTRPLATAIGAVAIVLALTVSGVADTILTVFEPKRIVTVQVDPRQLGAVPDPSAYGTLTWVARPEWHRVPDRAAAAAELGAAPLAPASLPAGIPSTPQFVAIGATKATFQFDEAKAKAAAATSGRTAPVPPAIAATILTLTGGPAVVQRYGGTEGTAGQGAVGMAALAGGVIVVQAKAPLVTSNGATVDELRDFALSQPGMPPALAAQIRAIGDPVGTLLVPIGVDPKGSKTVTVRGTQGYLIGDGTGLGSAVLWLEKGYVVGVAGPLKEGELLALANGLR